MAATVSSPTFIPIPIFPLSSPLGIYQEALRVFPSAGLKKVQDRPLVLELSVHSKVAPLRLSSAVDKFPFITELHRLFVVTIRMNCAFEAVLDGPIDFDARRFTLASHPLSDWQICAKAIYSMRNKCEDLIKEFLAHPDLEANISRMRSLDLLPEVVEKEVDGEDNPEALRYFRLAVLDLPPSDPRIVTFRRLYPKTIRRIAVDIERARSEEPREDPYQVNLRALSKQVVGQSYATSAIAARLASTRPGKNHVFLFVGPTGIGKTELAKAIASQKKAVALQKKERFIRFDMNVFSDEHSSGTLFGSPTGYVGSTDKPQLAKEFERYPEAIDNSDPNNIIVTGVVLLLDEFEKAHPTLRQTFLTLFDEGYCTVRFVDDRTNVSIKYILKDSFIIGTSNLGKDVIINAFLRNLPIEEVRDAFKKYNSELQKMPTLNSYSDELLGRMTIVPFGPIPRGETYQKLLELNLNRFLIALNEEIECKEVNVENRGEVIRRLEEQCYGEGIDIRRIERKFLELKTFMISQKNLLGDVTKIKLSLCPHTTDPRKLIMNVSVFSPLIDGYIPKPGFEFCPLP